MSKNTGIPYEKLTQTIFNEIVNQHSVETIDVQQNVILKGKTVSHQIDVYWKFNHGGIDYHTIIQCKDWASPVKLEQLLTFKGVIDDLPYQPRGIFVTKKGYQKSAKEFAEKNGIELFELREFTAEDEKGRIKTVVLNINAFFPHCSLKSVEPDNQWLTEFMESKNIDKETRIEISGLPTDMWLFDGDFKPIKTLQDEMNLLFPKEYIEQPLITKEVTYESPVFIQTKTEGIPYLLIKKIFVNIEVRKEEMTEKIEFDDVISFILKNITTNEEHLVKNDLKLLR